VTPGSEPPGSCDLGGKALRVAVSEAERKLRAAHLSSCIDCRVMARLNADFEALGDLRPADEAIVDAAAEATIARLGRADRTAKRRAMPGLLALVLWIGASAGAVAAGHRLVRLASNEAAVRSPRGTDDHPGHHAKIAGEPVVGAVASVPTRPPVSAAPISVVEAPRSRRSVRVALAAPPNLSALSVREAGGPTEGPSSAGAPAASPTPTARQLLAAGTAARAGGARARAVDLFRRLQELYPGSAEARVALVSSGQLLLDSGDFAGAAAAFGGYRRKAPAGALIEEALDGLARSLAGLRRFDDERQIWRELVERFPRSAYLPRATQRLGRVPR